MVWMKKGLLKGKVPGSSRGGFACSGKKICSLFVAVALAFGLVACGTPAAGGSSAGPAASASAPAASQEQPAARPDRDRAGNPITVPEKAERIACLAPATAQVLEALGLSDRLVAVDTQTPLYCDGLPQGVLQLDMMAPDLEQLVALGPDILFVSSLSSAGGEDIFKAVRQAGICVAEVPTAGSLQDIKEDLVFIAACVGLPERGEQLAGQLQAALDEVAAAAAQIPEAEKKTVLFEISPLPYLYSFGSGVYLDELLQLLGAKNALAGQEGWLAVEEESAVAANPDVILTNDNFSGADPVAEILARPGWQGVGAVQTGQVFYIDNAASSQPNHNVVKALHQMALAVYPDIYGGFDWA